MADETRFQNIESTFKANEVKLDLLIGKQDVMHQDLKGIKVSLLELKEMIQVISNGINKLVAPHVNLQQPAVDGSQSVRINVGDRILETTGPNSVQRVDEKDHQVVIKSSEKEDNMSLVLANQVVVEQPSLEEKNKSLVVMVAASQEVVKSSVKDNKSLDISANQRYLINWCKLLFEKKLNASNAAGVQESALEKVQRSNTFNHYFLFLHLGDAFCCSLLTPATLGVFVFDRGKLIDAARVVTLSDGPLVRDAEPGIFMVELDGTVNFVLLAVSKAGAVVNKLSLYKHIANLAGNRTLVLLVLVIVVINGGSHSGNKLAREEFMILLVGEYSLFEGLKGSELVTMDDKPDWMFFASAIGYYVVEDLQLLQVSFLANGITHFMQGILRIRELAFFGVVATPSFSGRISQKLLEIFVPCAGVSVLLGELVFRVQWLTKNGLVTIVCNLLQMIQWLLYKLCRTGSDVKEGKCLVVAASHFGCQCHGLLIWDQMFSKERVVLAVYHMFSLLVLYQLSVTLGIMLAYLLGFLLIRECLLFSVSAVFLQVLCGFDTDISLELHEIKRSLASPTRRIAIHFSVFCLSIGSNDYILYYLRNLSRVQTLYLPWCFY